jgi:hypothetical protein
MGYREYESAASLLKETQAAQRLARHWRGVIIPAEQYEPYDRVMVDRDGSTAALVEIKVRNYDIEYLVTHHYLLSLSKVKSLNAAAKRRSAVPLVMVVCADADFLLDLRDESGTSLRRLPLNDRHFDDRTGQTQMRYEWLMTFAGARFLPIDIVSRLL